MEAKQRKEKFIALLNELLNEIGGVKVKLAQKLEINSSTLTRWLQGQTDPATLDLINFIRLSKLANLSADELAKLIGILPSSSEEVLDKFQTLVKDLLSTQSLEQLGSKLGVSHGAISGWLNPKRKVNPQKVYIGTITALAIEKGWTLERLLIYLGFKEPLTEDNLKFKLESAAINLSLNDQIDLLASLLDLIQEKIKEREIIEQSKITYNNRTICVILERADLAESSKYLKNLFIHTDLNPENISIATIALLPQSLEEFDTIVFDLDLYSTETISVIEKISFDRNILVFAPPDVSEEVRSTLANQVTEIVVKPIDWESLKDKPYFR